MSVGIGAFAAAAFVAFLWPTGTGGFGGTVAAGKLDAIKDGIKQGGGFFYVPEAKSWITAYPAEALPLPGRSTPERARRHGSRASSCSARSARTSAAASPSARRASGSSASATARSTTGSVRRRPVRRRAAWITTRPPSRQPVTSSIDTGTAGAGSCHRYQHHRSGSRRPALHGRRRALMTPCRIDHDEHRGHQRRRSSRSAGSSTASSTSSPVGARSARRSSWPRTARSTTTTRRSKVHASSGCSCSVCSCW